MRAPALLCPRSLVPAQVGIAARNGVYSRTLIQDGRSRAGPPPYSPATWARTAQKRSLIHGVGPAKIADAAASASSGPSSSPIVRS